MRLLSKAQPNQDFSSWMLDSSSHDGAMSTVDSLSTGIVMSPDDPTGQDLVVQDSQQPPDDDEDRHDIRTLTFSSILIAHLFGPPFSPAVAPMDSSGPYIECDAKWFVNGIEYSPTYFQRVFPAAWVLITDARIKLKNILYIELGSLSPNVLITSHATSFLSELDGISSAMGQPVERGKYFFSV